MPLLLFFTSRWKKNVFLLGQPAWINTPEINRLLSRKALYLNYTFWKVFQTFFFWNQNLSLWGCGGGWGGGYILTFIHYFCLSLLMYIRFFVLKMLFFFPKEIIRGRIPQGGTCRQFAPFCTAARKTADWRSAAGFQGSWSLRTVCKYKDGPINHVQGFLSRLEKNVYSSSYSEASNHKCI